MPPERPPERSGKFIPGVIAGVLVVTSFVGYGVVSLIDFGLNKYPSIKEKVEPYIPWSPKQEDDFPQPIFISLFYKGDKDPVDIWEFSLKGKTELTGKLKTVEGNPGIVRGFHRGNYLVIDYTSADVKRPGFGRFIFRETLPSRVGDQSALQGVAVICSCKREDGTIDPNPPIITVPALLRHDRTIPPDVQQTLLQIDPKILVEPAK